MNKDAFEKTLLEKYMCEPKRKDNLRKIFCFMGAMEVGR